MSLIKIKKEKKQLTRDTILGTEELTPVFYNKIMYPFSGLFGDKEGSFILPHSGEVLIDTEIPGTEKDLAAFEIMKKRGDLQILGISMIDMDEEKKNKRDESKLYIQVYSFLDELREDDVESLKRLARRKGLLNMTGQSADDVFDFLVDLAKKDPKSIKSAIEDAAKEVKYLFDEAIDKKVIVWNTVSEAFFFGGNILGRSEELAVSRLATDEETRTAISTELSGGKSMRKNRVSEKRNQQADDLQGEVKDRIEEAALLEKLKYWQKNNIVRQDADGMRWFDTVALGKTGKEVMAFLTDENNESILEALMQL